MTRTIAEAVAVAVGVRTPVLRAAWLSLPTAFLWLGVAWLLLACLPERAWLFKQHGLFVLGAIGLYRYGWLAVNHARAAFYSQRRFPELRAAAAGHAGNPPRRVYFVIPSFFETPFISEKVFEALAREVQSISSRVIAIVAVGSDRDAELIRKIVKTVPGPNPPKLIFMKQAQGKRVALGHALRAASRDFHAGWHADVQNDLVVLMDGDTLLAPGSLAACLPFFRSQPDLAGATTDEVGVVLRSSRWTEAWFQLKFMKRHVMMKSHALSRRVLTLTGRFSLFRASAILSEEAIGRIESDYLFHWSFGRIRFLMGDDKSTWFELLARDGRMLYIADTAVYCLEARTGPFLATSLSLMRRWSGNMLRNNWRAIRLGPRRLPFFIWLALVDQRINMWTSLFGPVSMLLLALTRSPYFLVFYLAWVVLTRLAQLAMLVAHGRPVHPLHVPLSVYDQWVGSCVKVYNLYNLDKQSWSKAGHQKTQRQEMADHPRLRRFVSRYLLGMYGGSYVVAVGVLCGALTLPPFVVLALPGGAPPPPPAPAAGVLDARELGVAGGDGRDDAGPLSRALAGLPAEGAFVIELPAGELLFEQPLVIRRSDVTLRGAGRQRTRITSRFRVGPGPRAQPTAALRVAGTRGDVLGRTRAAAARGRTALLLRDPLEAAPEAVVWLGAGNDEALFDALGSRSWRREHPWLRQAILPLAARDGRLLLLREPLPLDLPADSVVRAARMPARVGLEGFSLRHDVPGATPASVRGVFENAHPAHAVDGVRFEWARDGWIHDVRLEMSGRHPLVFESSRGIRARGLVIDGAWNKGAGGNGYVRFARAFDCELRDSEVRNIRHVTFQWSSAGNRITDSRIEVDVNFHGGLARDNEVRGSTLEPAPGHPWPAVVRTPDDAPWAPPDGPGNRVAETRGGPRL